MQKDITDKHGIYHIRKWISGFDIQTYTSSVKLDMGKELASRLQQDLAAASLSMLYAAVSGVFKDLDNHHHYLKLW